MPIYTPEQDECERKLKVQINGLITQFNAGFLIVGDSHSKYVNISPWGRWKEMLTQTLAENPAMLTEMMQVLFNAVLTALRRDGGRTAPDNTENG